MGRILRIVTVLCYFLPFTFFLVTCNGGWTASYNRKEADKNLALEKAERVQDTTVGQASVADTSVKLVTSDTVTRVIYQEQKNSKSKELLNWILDKIMTPAQNALSGISSVYMYKNKEGKVLIAVSILLSLTTLFLWRFLKRKRIALAILLTNLFCFVALIVDSFSSQVTLLWGAWTIFALLIIQLGLEIRKKQG